MQFTLYTQKTVSQSLKELNERLHAKPTKANPELGGWVDKDGAFSLTLTGTVIWRLKRTTRLSGRVVREKGNTVIYGYVSTGVSPQWMRALLVLFLILCGIIAFSGEPLIAIMVALFGAAAYVPLRGDYVNSDVLLIAVERTLKADPKPPKK